MKFSIILTALIALISAAPLKTKENKPNNMKTPYYLVGIEDDCESNDSWRNSSDKASHVSLEVDVEAIDAHFKIS